MPEPATALEGLAWQHGQLLDGQPRNKDVRPASVSWELRAGGVSSNSKIGHNRKGKPVHIPRVAAIGRGWGEPLNWCLSPS